MVKLLRRVVPLLAVLLVAACSGDSGGPSDSAGSTSVPQAEASPGATPATLDHLVTLKEACPRLRLIMRQLGTTPTTHTSVLAGFRLHELRTISEPQVWPVIDRFLVVVGRFVSEPSGQAFADVRAADAAASRQADRACQAVGSTFRRAA